MNKKSNSFKKKPPYQWKGWTYFKAESSWQIFRIMSEFVEGFDKLNRIGPCISVYGSARAMPGSKYYKLAEKLGKLLTKAGFGVITGGGPGIMEAANKGAQLAKGKSVGCNINLPFEQLPNKYIDPDKLINSQFFFVRKVMLFKYAQGFVFFPGGYGTLDELFEALTLVQTRKIHRLPIILVGKEYWEGLFKWIKEVQLDTYKTIDAIDLALVDIVDSPEEVIRIINDFYAEEEEHELSPNF